MGLKVKGKTIRECKEKEFSLHSLVEKGYSCFFNNIMDYIKDISIKNEDSCTALMLASSNGHR